MLSVADATRARRVIFMVSPPIVLLSSVGKAKRVMLGLVGTLGVV